ncbi:MAG: DUF2252 domain-containing protein [Actinomycetota bacterium]
MSRPPLGSHPASPEARRGAGQERRRDVPLELHAELCPDDERDDPLALLAAQDQGRVQDLVPIRYGRMSRTAFTFLRGAASVMASDLSRTPHTDLPVQLCGDAHVSNFGLFNSAERRLVFDLNDFDETLPGPFEWDLKRLVASITVCARNNGISEDKGRAATTEAVAAFRRTITEVADLDPLDLHYHRIDVEELLERVDQSGASKKDRKKARKGVRKAKRKNSLRAFRKLTDIVDGRRVIVPDPPLVVPLRDMDGEVDRNALARFFESYLDTLPSNRQRLLRRYGIVDVARKVVGVGSVGTRCLIVLLESGGGHPLFLQFKEATDSVLEPYLEPSRYEQAGHRVVAGQRLIQASGDIFLGWARLEVDGHEVDFYFRQLWDGKGSFDVEDMGAKRLRRYARSCGAALALAHARSGDAAMIDGYVGDDATFDEALADFAEAYADRNEADYARLTAAIDGGDIEVVTDI